MATNETKIRLTASDETRAAFESAGRNVEQFTGGLVSLNGIMGGLTVGALATSFISFGKAAMSAAEESEQAQLKLAAVYKATGGAVGFTTGELNRMADAVAGMTHFDDESIRNGMSEIIKFGNVTGAVFKDSLKVISDYAAFSGQEFPAAASAVAQALAGPESAAKLLKTAGVILTEQQKDLIQSLKAAGDEAGAQRVILTELEGTYGGMEETLNSGLTGATKALSKEWGDLLESFGNTAGATAIASHATGGLASAIKGIREAIDEADKHFKTSAMFGRGKGEALQLTNLPGQEDTGPLAGKTVADVQAANAAIAAAQKTADDAAAAAAKVKHDAQVKAVTDKNEKILAAAQRFDEASAMAHEDAFFKWLSGWQKIEDQLTSLGAAGVQDRIVHEAEYTRYVEAENAKRNEAAEAAHAKRTASLVDAQDARFAALRERAEFADATDLEKAQSKQAQELADLEIQRMIMATDHELTLGELALFEQAKADIIAGHRADIEGAEENHVNQMIAIAMRGGLRREEFEKLSGKNQLLVHTGMMKGFIGAASQQSQALFSITKAARLAEAAIALPTTVMHAYKSGMEAGGPFGPAVGAAYAAIAFASQMVNINAIKSASFGGGASGSAPSASGGSLSIPGQSANPYAFGTSSPAPPPTSAPAPATQQIHLTIIGGGDDPDKAQFSYNSVVNGLLPILKEAKNNGHLVDVTVELA